MAKTYNQFYNEVLNKAFDVDGWYGAQCWDGMAYYEKWLGYPVTNTDIHGYACDIWESRHTNGILKNFYEVYVMQAGDICVFKSGNGWTPLSHVAIFHADAGGGYGWFLGQNQKVNDQRFCLIKLPYSITFDTAFRPRCFATKSNTTNVALDNKQVVTQPKVEEWYDGVCYVGCTVKSVSCAIQGIKGNLVYVSELGGMIPLAHVTESPDSKDGNPNDDYLATTNARVYLSPCKVEAIDARNNLVMVHGYWVKPEKLRIKK